MSKVVSRPKATRFTLSAVRHAVYITYDELFDRHPEWSELNVIIAELPSADTVMLCARLSTMFRHFTFEPNPKGMFEFQSWFINNFFDPETKKRMIERFGSEDPNRRPVCHPLQLLNIMRLALAVEGSGTDLQPEFLERHRYRLGTACLMMNDLFCTTDERQQIQTGPQAERKKYLILQILASFEVSNPTRFRNLLVRSFFIYRIALQQLDLTTKIKEECEGLDFEQKFEEVTGTPLAGWRNLVIGLYTLLIDHTLEEFLSKPAVFAVNRKTLLEDSLLSTPQVNSFFDRLSWSMDELRTELKKGRNVDERSDVVPFMAKPFLNFAPDLYTCVDLALLSEKLNNGPYFLLSSLLPEDERRRVFKAWGFLFEAYVNWLLQGLQGRHSANLYTDTCWEADREKSFDAVILKGRLVVVMEFKSGFLKQEARYSNDVSTFMEDLDKKFGVGCKQLARDTAQLFPDKGKGRKLSGVPVPSTTDWVLPILVVQDLALRTPFINNLLNQRFQSERKSYPVKKRVEVLPLNVIPISALELLVEMAEAVDLDVISVLYRRCRADSSMTRELQTFISELPEASKPGDSQRFQQIFDKSREEMCATLFKANLGAKRPDSETRG